MNCKNYYLMEREDLLKAIRTIHDWLSLYKDHPEYKRAAFAFHIAICAYNHYHELRKDEWAFEVVSLLTNGSIDDRVQGS